MTNTAQPGTEQNIESLLAKGIKIPPQPKILLEIDQLMQREDFSMKALAAAIGKDVGLTAAVFKIVNSPGMGSARRINSLDQAVAALGAGPMVTLVKCSALRQALGGNTEALNRFWEHAGDIASVAAAIARKLLSVCNVFPEQAYTAGLFMDCGVPILMERFPAYCADYRSKKTGGWPKLIEEDAKIDASHTAIGYLIARHWKLPDFIAYVIRDHHDAIPHSPDERTLACILLMAAHVRNQYYNWEDDPEWLQHQAIALEELGLTAEALPEFEEDIRDSVWG
jgi:HD-like signal output (HDOD) protein